MARKQGRVGQKEGLPTGNQGRTNNKCIILYIASHKPVSAGILAEMLGVSRQMVHIYLNELEQDLFIFRDKRGVVYLTESSVLSEGEALRREIWLSLGEPLAEKLKLVIFRQSRLWQ